MKNIKMECQMKLYKLLLLFSSLIFAGINVTNETGPWIVNAPDDYVPQRGAGI
jgi:hypothetical protein